MFLDLLDGRLAWLRSQAPRRTLFFLLVQFHYLSLASFSLFSVEKWAEISLVSLLAPMC